MESFVIPLIVAVTASTTMTPAPHASVGSNMGPGVPIILALVVIGVATYVIRQHRRRPPNGDA
jgi:hypothetical protein